MAPSDPGPRPAGRPRPSAVTGAPAGLLSLLPGAALAALVVGCAAPTGDGGDSAPVVVFAPQGPPTGSGALDAVYGSILAQCREAFRERDADRLADLLALHDGPQAPPWAGEQFAMLRSAERSLRFTLRAFSYAGLSSARERVAAGEEIPLVLRLESAWEEEVVLHGEEGERRSALYLEIRVRDEDGRGNAVEERHSMLVPLEEAIRLAPGESRSVPFPFPTEAPGRALVRTYVFGGDLVLAGVRSAGSALPVHRLPLAPCRVQVLPPGFEAIQDAALETLKEAVRREGAGALPHLYLACLFLDQEERREAGDLLAVALRRGGADLQEVAAACMERLFGPQERRVLGMDLPVRGRDDWLVWWQENRGRF